MQFTLVSTVLNESKRLWQTITDIKAQTLQPAEIIITDAGSTDGTWELLQEWQHSSGIPIILLLESGCNVARGRNLAIETAKNNLIVSTDFGCRFHPEWLASLIKPFTSNEEIEVAAGAFTIIEADVNTDAAKADYILQAGYPVVLDEYFSATNRSIAYYKYVWEKIGGYPEWLTLAADDTIFWKLVKKNGFRYALVQEPFVYWIRHKTNRGFAREAYRYGLGDGESRINSRNFRSSCIETIMRYLFFLLFFFTISQLIFFYRVIPLFYCSLFLVLTLSGLRSYYNAFKNWQKLKSEKYNFKIFFLALFQLELSRIQYIRGYLKGFSDKDQWKKDGRKLLWKALSKV